MIKKEKGVTLVALVVTIIVLIILASITIGAIKGDNGIINESKDAKEDVERQQWEERIDTSIIATEGKHRNPTLEQVIEEMIKDGIIDSKDQVDENGTITTNEPVYEIEGKLDDYLDKDTPEEPDPGPEEPVLAEHTVTYDYKTNEGLSAGKTSEKLEEGEAVDLSVVSSKSGYEFVGWNTNSNAHEGLTTLKMGTSDITLYAIYKKEIVATFNYRNGNSVGEDSRRGTVYNKETSISITTPTITNADKDGVIYTPRGWSEENVGTGEIVATSGGSLQISNSKEYYALYEGSTKVTFYYYNGSGQTSESGTSGTTMNTLGDVITSETIAIPSIVRNSSGPNGTRYAGVSVSTNSTSGETGTTVSTSNSVYYAYYNSSVTFYYNSGTNSYSSQQSGTRTATTSGYSYSTSITNKPTPSTYNGISFSHWSNTSGQDYEADPSTTSSTLYYAVYDGERSVPFTYWNGYSSSTAYATGGRKYISTTSYIVSTGGTITVPEVVRNSSGPSGTSYAFVSSSATGTYEETPTADGTMYYAIYSKQITITKNTYYYTPKYQYATIYGYTTGRTSSSAITLTSDSNNYNLPSGYSFYGWSTSSSASGTVISSTTIYPTANTTYYAIYKKSITVSYNLNGGSGYVSSQNSTVYMNYEGKTIQDEELLAESAPIQNNGNVLVYWENSTLGGYYKPGDVINVGENITLLANWYYADITSEATADMEDPNVVAKIQLYVKDINDVIRSYSSVKIYKASTLEGEGTEIPIKGFAFDISTMTIRFQGGIVTKDHEGYYYFGFTTNTYGSNVEIFSNRCHLMVE